MKRKSMKRSLSLLFFAILTLASCGGCAAGQSKAAATTAAAAQDMAFPVYSAMEAPAEVGAPVQETAQETAVYDEERVQESGLLDNTSASGAFPAGRKLIRNVDLAVETDIFDQLLKTLTAQVGESGGYVEQSDISGNSMNYQNEPVPRNAFMTIRLPISKIDGFITNVESSANVIKKSESTQDVTLQYSDLESRKKSLKVEQDRIWALLEKADTLEAVIALESRLSDIRFELESMESQLRLYDNQVDYSTINLYVNEIKGAAAFTPTAPETFGQRIQNGFIKNLNAMTQWLTGFVIWLITFSPFWLPVVLVVSVVLLIACKIRRRRGKKAEQEQPSESKVGLIDESLETEENKNSD